MNSVLWAVQGLLAAAFLLAGFMKAARPIDELSKQMAWVTAVPSGFVRFLGVAEILGAIGIILPLVTGILPWLTVAAAIGLIVVQISAIVFHVARNEQTRLPVNVALLLMAVLIVVGRVAIIPAA